MKKGEPGKALADFNEAIRLDPNATMPYRGRALIYATCPDARLRDGKKAVEDATKACEITHWKEGNNLGSLAAAYAESGDFDSAVEWQTKARDLAPEKEKADFESRLDLFKAHKPYREEVKK